MTSVVKVIGRAKSRNSAVKTTALWSCAGTLALWASLCLFPVKSGFSQQAPVKRPNAPQPSAQPPAAGADEDQPLPGDWGPELLYNILSSPNEEAQFALLRATFAAGPAMVPQLTEALKDDRTAEYAAQSLAFIGGDQALPILWKLLSDSRDLDLRRFTYSALAEYDSPQATDLLLDAITKSDAEPDRTVTEAAVIALTVRTDTSLLPRLAASERNLQDVVIRDDIDNARAVIEERAKYLASLQGKKAGGSVESAVRTYFLPALEAEAAPAAVPTPSAKTSAGKPTANPPVAKPHPLVTVDVRNVTLSPDKNRALARVLFEDPSALAYYDFVLAKRDGDWQIASVWLGPEAEKKAEGSRQSALDEQGDVRRGR
jgi:hypothetical protein